MRETLLRYTVGGDLYSSQLDCEYICKRFRLFAKVDEFRISEAS